MEIYKVRNEKGLYWEGNNHRGSYYFTEKGKQWKKLHHVKAALRCSKPYINKELPEHLKKCEIVKFELKEIEIIKIE